LILNQFLPSEELQQTLSREKFKDLEFILKILLSSKKNIRSIFEEEEILGQIHHSTNMSNYAKKEFRKKLFNVSRTSVPAIWENYFSQCGLGKRISDMTETELLENTKKYVEFEWGNNKLTKKFLEVFKYPDYLIFDHENDIPSEEIIFGLNAKFEPLKMILSYQAPIVEKTLKKIEILNARCLIQMPTGTGKTRTMMEILGNLLNENPNIQIIWVANSPELLEQARDAFIHVWNHVGKNPIKIIKVWGTENIPKIPEERVIVFAGYEKMRIFLEKNNLLKPHYIVIDEAHRMLAKTFKKSICDLTNFDNSTRVIGLTATPGRGIDQIQNNLLVEEFHNEIIQIELDKENEKIYEKNIIKCLEDQGILSKAIYVPLKTEFDIELLDEDSSKLGKLIEGDRKELSEEFLEKLGNDNKRNLLIIEKLKHYAEEGKKILYFATDVSQSILIFAALQQIGVNAIHVDGKDQSKTGRAFRRQVIKKFKETNEISIICNYNIFSTGFDVPDLDVVFIGRPIMSPVLLSQIIGRGTRGPKMGSKNDSFLLVQVTDNIKSKNKKFNLYEHYSFWERNWKNE
jgi:DNA repair protein RadD